MARERNENTENVLNFEVDDENTFEVIELDQCDNPGEQRPPVEFKMRFCFFKDIKVLSSSISYLYLAQQNRGELC